MIRSLGLPCGSCGQGELVQAGAYRVYEDPAELTRHIDELGVRVHLGRGGSRPEAAGRGKTRDLHVPGLHPLLWATSQERNFHRMADHCEEADGGETQSHQG